MCLRWGVVMLVKAYIIVKMLEIQSPVGSMVELRRLELLTPYLQSRCSPS